MNKKSKIYPSLCSFHFLGAVSPACWRSSSCQKTNKTHVRTVSTNRHTHTCIHAHDFFRCKKKKSWKGDLIIATCMCKSLIITSGLAHTQYNWMLCVFKRKKKKRVKTSLMLGGSIRRADSVWKRGNSPTLHLSLHEAFLSVCETLNHETTGWMWRWKMW